MKDIIKCISKNRYLIALILICIVATIWCIYVSVNALNGPIVLTDHEVEYYSELAENVWNANKRPSNPLNNSNIKYSLDDESITISSYNAFKESVTVYFNETGNEIVINQPKISFTGCFIFHAILALVSIAFASLSIYFILKDIIDDRKERKKLNNTTKGDTL